MTATPLTREEWEIKRFEMDAIKTLAMAYRLEHDWDHDEDPTATLSLIHEALALHDALVTQLGPAPDAEAVAVIGDGIPF